MRALLLTLLLAACSPSSQQKAINVAYSTVDTSAKAFSAFDGPYEQSIVAGAATKADADAKLAAYRATRAKIETAITTAYQSVALAATVQEQQNIDGMVAAVSQLTALLATIGVKP